MKRKLTKTDLECRNDKERKMNDSSFGPNTKTESMRNQAKEKERKHYKEARRLCNSLQSLLGIAKKTSRKYVLHGAIQYIRMLEYVLESGDVSQGGEETRVAYNHACENWMCYSLNDNFKAVLQPYSRDLPLTELVKKFPYIEKLLSLKQTTEDKDCIVLRNIAPAPFVGASLHADNHYIPIESTQLPCNSTIQNQPLPSLQKVVARRSRSKKGTKQNRLEKQGVDVTAFSNDIYTNGFLYHGKKTETIVTDNGNIYKITQLVEKLPVSSHVSATNIDKFNMVMSLPNSKEISQKIDQDAGQFSFSNNYSSGFPILDDDLNNSPAVENECFVYNSTSVNDKSSTCQAIFSDHIAIMNEPILDELNPSVDSKLYSNVAVINSSFNVGSECSTAAKREPKAYSTAECLQPSSSFRHIGPEPTQAVDLDIEQGFGSNTNNSGICLKDSQNICPIENNQDIPYTSTIFNDIMPSLDAINTHDVESMDISSISDIMPSIDSNFCSDETFNNILLELNCYTSVNPELNTNEFL